MVYIRLVAQIVTNNAKGLVRFFETQVWKIIPLKGNQYFKTPATTLCYTLLHFWLHFLTTLGYTCWLHLLTTLCYTFNYSCLLHFWLHFATLLTTLLTTLLATLLTTLVDYTLLYFDYTLDYTSFATLLTTLCYTFNYTCLVHFWLHFATLWLHF